MSRHDQRILKFINARSGSSFSLVDLMMALKLDMGILERALSTLGETGQILVQKDDQGMELYSSTNGISESTSSTISRPAAGGHESFGTLDGAAPASGGVSGGVLVISILVAIALGTVSGAYLAKYTADKEFAIASEGKTLKEYLSERAQFEALARTKITALEQDSRIYSQRLIDLATAQAEVDSMKVQLASVMEKVSKPSPVTSSRKRAPAKTSRRAR